MGSEKDNDKDELQGFSFESDEGNEHNSPWNVVGSLESENGHEEELYRDEHDEHDEHDDEHDYFDDGLKIANPDDLQTQVRPGKHRNVIMIVSVVSVIFLAMAGAYLYFTKPIGNFILKAPVAQVIPPLKNTQPLGLKAAPVNNTEIPVKTFAPTHLEPQDPAMEHLSLIKPESLNQVKDESLDRIFAQLEKIGKTTRDLNTTDKNTAEISAINAKIDNLRTDVHLILKKLGDLNSTPSHVTKKTSSKPKIHNKSSVDLSSYAVESIARDQAYVLNKKTNKRQMITVGDTLTEGVSVTKIDVTHYQVVTTAGKILFQ